MRFSPHPTRTSPRPRLGLQTSVLRLRLEELESRTLPAVSIAGQLFPNDPSYNQAFQDANLYGLTKIQAPTVWGEVTTGSRNVVVANIDSGIDYTHPDLRDNIWINQGEIPDLLSWNDIDLDGRISFVDLNNDFANRSRISDINSNNVIDGQDLLAAWSNLDDADGNGYTDDLIGWDFINGNNDPFDDNGHGTHTAGTTGAVGNNGVGIVGVNWAVSIMALKIIAGNGTGSEVAAGQAIRYAVDNGARTSNNSWSTTLNHADIASAVAYAQGKEHVIVAAAGNRNAFNDIDQYPAYPASYGNSNVISVTATDTKDRRPRWANYGSTSVDLGAPGVAVLSTVPGGAYALASGTSMATPHVTGVVALLLANDSSLTAAEVKTAILAGVDPASSLNGKTVTEGRLNAAKVFNLDPGTPPPDDGGGKGGGGGGGAGGKGKSLGGSSVSADALAEIEGLHPDFGQGELVGVAPLAAPATKLPPPLPSPIVPLVVVQAEPVPLRPMRAILALPTAPLTLDLSGSWIPESPGKPHLQAEPRGASTGTDAAEEPQTAVTMTMKDQALTFAAPSEAEQETAREPSRIVADGLNLVLTWGLLVGGLALNPPRSTKSRHPRLKIEPERDFASQELL